MVVQLVFLLSGAILVDHKQKKPSTHRAAFVGADNPESCPTLVGEGLDGANHGPFAKCNAHFERIRLIDVPTPTERLGSAVIRVAASSINPHDWEDLLGDVDRSHRPRMLGIDVAGTIVGSGCSDFKPQDKVWATTLDCADQEYVEVSCGAMGHMPANLTFVEAAGIPICALTNLQAFRMAGAPWKNSPTVLILGGSSGTGTLAIQMAKAMGAGKIISTASPNNFDLVKRLGADEVLDYHTQNWWEVLPPNSVQVIYDCVSGVTGHAHKVLSKGGHFVTIFAFNGLARGRYRSPHRDISEQFFLCNEVGTERLNVLKAMVERGQLHPVTDSVYDFENIRDAFEHSRKNHAVGKIILKME